MKVANQVTFPGNSGDKEPAAMWETQVQSLGWADPLEKEMATCCSILVWEIPWIEESGRLGCKEFNMTATNTNQVMFLKIS